jgi:DNA-binding HxlR family transcriptional regulator
VKTFGSGTKQGLVLWRVADRDVLNGSKFSAWRRSQQSLEVPDSISFKMLSQALKTERTLIEFFWYWSKTQYSATGRQVATILTDLGLRVKTVSTVPRSA